MGPDLPGHPDVEIPARRTGSCWTVWACASSSICAARPKLPETPDYVPDGARLVRICGLCLENGKEVDFSPEDRENLLKGMPDEAVGWRTPCTSGCSSATRRTRSCSMRWKPVRRRCSSCSAGKDRTGVAAILILLALGASDKTIAEDF